MRGRPWIAPFVALLGGAGILSAAPAIAVGAEPTGAEAPAISEGPTEPELSPQMLTLRDNVRRALAGIADEPFSLGENSPAELIPLCLVYGCEASVRYDRRSAKKVNAIGALCWNIPGAGHRLLRAGREGITARIGYGLQAYPSQFLAVLAQSAVPADYEVRVGDVHGTVADLVDYEKRSCRSGSDLSGKLIGLAYYVKGEAGWQNDLGEDWSIERLIEEELGRVRGLSRARLTRCLMGLSYAVNRRVKRRRPIDGELLRAQQYVGEVQQYALGQQNSDGTWHPSFFTRKGSARDVMGTLRSTGHILRWLVFSLPQDRLQDPRVVRSVVYVSNVLNDQGRGWRVASMSPKDIGSVMHAAHALAIYDRRVFRAQTEETEETGQLDGQEVAEETDQPEASNKLEISEGPVLRTATGKSYRTTPK